jgi:hypothetical protein
VDRRGHPASITSWEPEGSLTGWRSCPPIPRLPEPEDRYDSLQFFIAADDGKGGDRDFAGNAVSARELNDGVHGSPLEQCNAHWQLLEWSGPEELWPLLGGQLADLLERHTVHPRGGLVEENEVPLGVEHGDCQQRPCPAQIVEFCDQLVQPGGQRQG